MPSKWCLLWIFNLHKVRSLWLYKTTHSHSNMLPWWLFLPSSVTSIMPLLWLLTGRHANWQLQFRKGLCTWSKHKRVKEPSSDAIRTKNEKSVEGGDWSCDVTAAQVLWPELPRGVCTSWEGAGAQSRQKAFWRSSRAPWASPSSWWQGPGQVLVFPGGSDGKESACNARHPGSIPGSGRLPGEGHGKPLRQYSCLENPMDRGAWRAAVGGVSESQTRLSTHAHIYW